MFIKLGHYFHLVLKSERQWAFHSKCFCDVVKMWHLFIYSWIHIVLIRYFSTIFILTNFPLPMKITMKISAVRTPGLPSNACMIMFFWNCHYKPLVRPKFVSISQVTRTDRLHYLRSTDYVENMRAFQHEWGINKELRFQNCFSEARPCFICNI